MNTSLFREPVSKIMTTNVITLAPRDLMMRVKEIFATENIHHIPVVDGEDRVIGIVSQNDFSKILHGFTLFRTQKSEDYNNAMLNALLVEDVMTKQVATLHPEDSITIAADIFKENLFHALPVVDNDKKLVGILTTYDLLIYVFNNFPLRIQ